MKKLGYKLLILIVLTIASAACSPSAELEEGGDAGIADPDSSGIEEPFLTGEACLVGNWQMDNESYLSLLQALAAEFGDGSLSYESVDGAMEVTFSEDGVVSNNSIGFSFTVCSGGLCNELQVPSSAATTYSYASDSGQINFSGGHIVAANFEDHERSDLAGIPGIYTCAGDQLSIQYAEYPTILFQRVP